MASYSPLGPTDICNLALQDIGSMPITDIDDTSSNAALACSAAFWQSVRECGRAHDWNCLKKRAPNLAPLPPFPVGNGQSPPIGWPGCQPTVPPPYWLPNTVYLGAQLVTYGNAIYYCLMGYTSSTNFINDLTDGFWAQEYSSFYAGGQGNTGGQYEWNFAYGLPADYLLITELNGQDCRERRGIGSLYEIFVVQIVNQDQSISNKLTLFCNAPTANVKYTAFIQDTTIFDPLFVGAVAILLASKVASQLRKDDGRLAEQLRGRFVNEVLPNAKLKDAGERKDRRYDPCSESAFLRSRYRSTNG